MYILYNTSYMKTLGLLFRSLYSNSAVVDGARGKKWWYAIIFFLLSTIISVIPIVTTTALVNGGQFLAANAYNLDRALPAFSTFLDKKKLDLVIDSSKGTLNGDGTLSIATWNTALGETTDPKAPLPVPFKYIEKIMVPDSTLNPTGSSKDITILEVYNFTTFKNELISENITRILKGDVITATMPDVPTKYETKDLKRTISFLILGKDTYTIYKFPNNKTNYSATGGDYLNLKDIKSLSEVKTYEDWQKFVELGYMNTKNKNCLVQTSIMLGINAGIVLLMGLMFFILTRGKANPYRSYTFWECMKISFWSMLSPAILSLVFGFFLTQFATLIFVLIFGVRAMWLSMKQLKPIA